MDDINALAQLIYAESGGEDYDTMKMVGSSVIKRLQSGRIKEFGENIQDVINSTASPYYSVTEKSPLLLEAQSGKFKDKMSEDAFKRSYAIASGLIKGTIKPDNVMFFFKPEEEIKLRKKGSKVFNFSYVHPTGKIGKYNLYSYDEPKSKSKGTSKKAQ